MGHSRGHPGAAWGTFQSGATVTSPGPQRIPASMPGRVLEGEQGEKIGDGTIHHPGAVGGRKESWLRPRVLCPQLPYRSAGSTFPALQPLSCPQPALGCPPALHLLILGFKPQAYFSYQPALCHICVRLVP